MNKNQDVSTFLISGMALFLAIIAVIIAISAASAETGCRLEAALCAKLAPGSLNDMDKTPGDVRTTDANVICHQKTSTIRNVSAKTKKQAFALYSLTRTTGWCKAKNCEIDHLISLELGGSNDIKNLWPQPYAGKWNARGKDKLENVLHRLICDGTITPEEAQDQISHDWISAYIKYVMPNEDARDDDVADENSPHHD